MRDDILRLCGMLLVVVAPPLSGCGRPPPEARPALRVAWQSGLASRLEPWGCPMRPTGGLERGAAWVARQRAAGQDVVFLDAGDTLVSAGPVEGRAEPDRRRYLERLGAAALDGWLPGESDLLSGAAALLDAAETHRIPIIGTNLRIAGRPAAVQSHRIVQGRSMRVGVIGILLTSHPALLERAGIVPADPFESARQALREIRPATDLVIAMIRVDGPTGNSAAARREALSLFLNRTPGVDYVLLGGPAIDQGRPLYIANATVLSGISMALQEVAFFPGRGDRPVHAPDLGELREQVRLQREEMTGLSADIPGLRWIFTPASERKRLRRKRAELLASETLLGRLIAGLGDRGRAETRAIRLDVPAPGERSSPPASANKGRIQGSRS